MKSQRDKRQLGRSLLSFVLHVMAYIALSVHDILSHPHWQQATSITHRARPAGPRNGSQRLARLEFCARSGRRKGWGLSNVRGVPLPCVTTVSTTSNLGLPRSVTSLGQ